LDESIGEAHATLAFIAMDYDLDMQAAEREFQHALALSPNYATAHHWYSRYLLFTGRHEEAIKEITRAQELDPLSLIIGCVVGMIHFSTGNLEQAEAGLRKTLDLGHDYAMAHNNLGVTLFLQGRHAEAITEAREAVRLSNSQHVFASRLAYMYAKTGQHEEARRILDDLIARSAKTYVPPTLFAIVHAGLDEKDQMFEWLERALHERDSWLLNYLTTDPLMAPMRSDRRFADLVRRVGLPPLTPEDKLSASLLDKGGQRAVTGDKIMLAVLPFENLSRDPEQEYFSDGLTEEMINQLGQLNPQKLSVIARTSAMHYRNTAKTVDEIGRELGVAYVVEGSVRRAENRVRITANLIQCADQSQLWANSVERELKDILALQSEVAQAVARQVNVKLDPQGQARLAAVRPVNPAAHEAYLRGRFHWHNRAPEGMHKGIEYFLRAIEVDPDYAPAHAGLADAYTHLARHGTSPPKKRSFWRNMRRGNRLNLTRHRRKRTGHWRRLPSTLIGIGSLRNGNCGRHWI
jgi:TolB-like protein/Tfp pilus assembly protein PilF